MDNRKFDIQSDRGLDHALAIAFQGAPGGKATHWKDDGGKRLILAWTDPKTPEWHPFTAPITAESAKAIIVDWLNAHPAKDTDIYFDGDTKNGWRIYCEDWGHIDHLYQAFVTIEPVVAYYGK